MRQARGHAARNLNSDYAKSGRLAEQAKLIARAGGLASGLARAIPVDVHAFRQRLSATKVSARLRGFDYSLTDAEFAELVTKDCWYCGGPPVQMWKKQFPGTPKYNGIDRIDNAKGYVTGNVVSCCALCNRAKHTMSVQDFLSLARRIVGRHGTDTTS